MSEQLTKQAANNNSNVDLGGNGAGVRKSVAFSKAVGANNNSNSNNNNDFTSMGITRERSFVRMPNAHHHHQQQHGGGGGNKRRSLAFGHPHQHALQQQQMRAGSGGGGGGKPALELYRPPNSRQQSPLENKLNVHAAEFQMARGDHLQNSRSSMAIFQPAVATLNGGGGGVGGGGLQLSKSGGNLHQQQQQQLQLLAARQLQLAQLNKVQQQQQQQRTSMVLQQQQQQQLQAALAAAAASVVMASGGNQGNGNGSAGTVGNGAQAPTRGVKFAPDPISSAAHQPQQYLHQHNQNDHMTASLQHQQMQLQLQQQQQHHQQMRSAELTPLQRSKSLSSAADAIARGIAGLGLGVVADTSEIGTFIPEIQALIDQARNDPNLLNARSLMELANHVMQRAVEGRRYALPTSRFCIAIIAKEHKETFLEALLNTCRQWYQERDKVLGTPHNIKNVSRPRFTAFMAFLTEMFCQLKRRQLQLRTQCDGVPPPLVLLTLLSMCCEDCVRPPVRSLSEIECLFFVLTCIGRDLEQHLPMQLEVLLASVRDAFLNASASAPAIRRTLLQLIELQASRWQLPGNTVLYYYPSNK